MFDGVHLGHQKIIECVKHFAAEKQGESVVITFDRHPKSVIENRPASFITSLNHRLSLLARLGVDNAVVLGFDQKLAQMTAEGFIKEIMLEWLGVKCVVLGFNCRFGKNREETARWSIRWRLTMALKRMDVRLSFTKIR